MGGESLWKILWKPVENSRIVLLFPPSNAYETVDELETSCEKPVPSQPSLHIRDETMKRSFFVSLLSITFSNLIPSCHLCYHIYTHRQSFTSMWKFIILASFDSYNTIKAIEIFCIKAFDYSEHIKGMLYC